MENLFLIKKYRLGALFGLIAGLGFALTCWGLDSLILSNAHAANPFIHFVPGLVLSILVGTLVGWLTVRVKHGWMGIFFWLAFAIFCTWLTLWLPVRGTPLLLRTVDPGTASMLRFPALESEGILWFFGLFVSILCCLVCGLLEGNLVEGALASSSRVAFLPTLLIAVFLLGISGFAADHLVTAHFREALTTTDELIQFAAQHYGEEVDKVTARKMHLSALKEVGDLVLQPYTLTLIEYEGNLGKMEVLVNFNGQKAKCTVLYSQPVRCVLLEGISVLITSRPARPYSL